MKKQIIFLTIVMVLLCCGCGKSDECEIEKETQKDSEMTQKEEIFNNNENFYVDVNKPVYAIERIEKSYDSFSEEWEEKIYRRDVYNVNNQRLFSWKDTDINAYLYDEKGVLIENHEVYTNLANVIESTFYENGNITYKFGVNARGTLYIDEHYEYDNNGNCISYESIDSDGVCERTVYTYKNDLLVLDEMYTNGIIKERNEYIYNDSNQLIQINHEWYYDGRLEEVSHWEYLHDEKGNRVEEKHYSNNRLRIHRKIEYYDTGELYTSSYINEDGIEKTVYNKKGDVIEKCSGKLKYVYIYDKDDRLVRKETYYVYSSGEEIMDDTSIIEYKYRRLSDAELAELLSEIFYYTENMY